MNTFDNEYAKLAGLVLDCGDHRMERTGTGASAIFGHQMRFNLQEGFPLLTTKKLHTKSIFIELLWFLAGSTNVKWLQDRGVTIWDEWADDKGELGPVYGKQWRRWEKMDWWEDAYSNDRGFVNRPIDQIAKLIDGLKNNPYSRRHIVTAWNPGEIDEMALPPCHMMFQMFVSSDKKLSCQLYQRSVDIGLGLPFNIASYALLTHLIAQVCGYEVGEFIHTSGDAHVYDNHRDAIAMQIMRQSFDPPKLILNPDIKNLEDFKIVDMKIEGYQSHPHIPMAVAV